MKMTRVWAMPNLETFSCKPIGALVQEHLAKSKISVDPFARNKRWATYTNDLNPKTEAEYHMQAVEFLRMLDDKGIVADLLLFDPPYSPRQVSECYTEAGMKAGMVDTQNGRLYKECRDAANRILREGSTVISCGWNSGGMGINRGYELLELLLVCHGGSRNDTIVTVEKKIPPIAGLFDG